jgi:putative transcriptional regulator
MALQQKIRGVEAMKNKIKVFRAMHDMTQEELADRIRVTRRTINSIERGKYNPSIEVAYNIAKTFGVRSTPSSSKQKISSIAKTFGVAIEEIFCFEDDEDAEARR